MSVPNKRGVRFDSSAPAFLSLASDYRGALRRAERLWRGAVRRADRRWRAEGEAGLRRREELRQIEAASDEALGELDVLLEVLREDLLGWIATAGRRGRRGVKGGARVGPAAGARGGSRRGRGEGDRARFRVRVG